MSRRARRLRMSRGLLFAAMGATVAIIGLKDLIAGTVPNNPLGASAVSLIWLVAVALGGAALLDFRRRTTAATLLVAVLAFAAGPMFAIVYGDSAAGIVGPLLGFAMVLPYLRRLAITIAAGSAAVAMSIIDVGLLDVHQRLVPRDEALLLNHATSMLAIGALTLYLLVTQHAALRHASGRYQRLFDRLPVAAYRSTPDGRLLDVNEAMVKLVGHRDRATLLAVETTDLYADPTDRPSVMLAAERGGTGTIALRRRDGKVVWAEYHARAERDQAGTVVAIEGALLDLTDERRAARLEVERQQIADALHRLAPSRNPDETSAAICAEIVRSPHFQYAGIFSFEPHGALYLHGGYLGDVPLPAQDVEASAASARTLARGHDGPWVEALENPTTDLGRMALQAGVSDLAYLPLTANGDVLGFLTAGTGSGDSALLGDRLPELVDFAAIASALLAPALHERRSQIATRQQVQNVIRDAAFHPVFQPLVDMRTRRIIGYEALTRFDDGTPPDAMFASAAQCGLGVELEIATLESAMSSVSRIPDNLFLDLNASPELVLATEPLRTHVRRWGSKVVIEVTEHARIDDYDELRAGIASLGKNVVLAVDDAGAGFASLRHILELRPQFVKLDRELVRDIDSDPARRALAAGMAHFAAQSDITLVAEGVETTEERRALVGLGVWAGQGYLFGRPQRMVRRMAVRSAA